MKKSSRKKKTPKRVLRLPDLDYAKGAVLNTLGSPESKRGYEFAIDDFVTWYCSEPRLAFSKTVVLRSRTPRTTVADLMFSDSRKVATGLIRRRSVHKRNLSVGG